MMDDHAVSQFVQQLQRALGAATGVSLHQVEMHLSTISSQLVTLAANSAKTTEEQKVSLATEALGALATENARLVKLLSEREIAMGELRIEHARTQEQMRMFLQDLSGTCIGCKKLPWQPHRASCYWAASADRLREVFSGSAHLNSGENQAEDDRVSGPAA